MLIHLHRCRKAEGVAENEEWSNEEKGEEKEKQNGKRRRSRMGRGGMREGFLKGSIRTHVHHANNSVIKFNIAIHAL